MKIDIEVIEEFLRSIDKENTKDDPDFEEMVEMTILGLIRKQKLHDNKAAAKKELIN